MGDKVSNDKLVLTKKFKGEDGHKTFSIRVRDETVEKLDKLAAKTNRSLNHTIITTRKLKNIFQIIIE